MPSPEAEQYGRQVIEMMSSLDRAVQEAGGTVFTAASLSTMTVMEFILNLAHNRVRFICEERKDGNDSRGV